MKYKVGDKVRVKHTLSGKDSNSNYGVTAEMIALAGKIMTIDTVYSYSYNVKENGWRWTDSMLEDPEALYIKRERVLEAIKKYPESKMVLESLFPQIKVTFSAGQRFMIDGSEGFLVQVGPKNVCMIHVKSGNRYLNPVEVSDAHAITEEELLKLFSSKNYKLIENGTTGN